MTKTKSNLYSFRFGLLVGFTAGLAIGFIALLFYLPSKSPKKNLQTKQEAATEKEATINKEYSETIDKYNKRIDEVAKGYLAKGQGLYIESIQARNLMRKEEIQGKALKYVNDALYLWVLLERQKPGCGIPENAVKLREQLSKKKIPQRPPHFRSPDIIPTQPESP